MLFNVEQKIFTNQEKSSKTNREACIKEIGITLQEGLEQHFFTVGKKYERCSTFWKFRDNFLKQNKIKKLTNNFELL